MNVQVLIGKQSAKGVEATKFFKLQATDYSIAQGTNVVNSNALTGSRFKGSTSFVSRINVDGAVPVEFTAQSLLMLVAGSGFAKDGVPVGDVQAYKVKDKVDDYYTIIMNDKQNLAYEKSVDCKINSLDLNLAVDTYVTGSINIIGGTSTYTTTSAFAGTIVEFADDQLICLNSTITKAGTDITGKLESVTFTINNNLEAQYALNSIYTTDIIEGNAELSGSLTYDKFDKALYKAGFDELFANTSSVVKVLLGTTSAKTDYIEFVFPKATPTSNDGGDWAGTGSLSQNYTFNYDKVTGTALTVNANTVVEPTYV